MKCPICGILGSITGTRQGQYSYGCNVAHVYTCGDHYWLPIRADSLISPDDFDKLPKDNITRTISVWRRKNRYTRLD